MEGITTQFLEENPAGLSPEMIYLKKGRPRLGPLQPGRN